MVGILSSEGAGSLSGGYQYPIEWPEILILFITYGIVSQKWHFWPDKARNFYKTEFVNGFMRFSKVFYNTCEEKL